MNLVGIKGEMAFGQRTTGLGDPQVSHSGPMPAVPIDWPVVVAGTCLRGVEQ